MNNNSYENRCLCRRCFIKLYKPNKREINAMVFTDYDDACDNCGRIGPVLEYIEDGD